MELSGEPDFRAGTMKWKGWERVRIPVQDPEGGIREEEAIAPLIISASRSTDIPAFYGEWFMDRLAAGYVRWNSPFGGRPVYVSLGKARLFVFWSKNPEPFLRYLGEIAGKGYGTYFMYTLNDYAADGLEPSVPPLDDRIRTFRRLSQVIGREKVVWRFDPLVLTDRITVPVLLERIGAIGDAIHGYTDRLVISFVEIERYRKVGRNLAAGGFPDAREFSDADIGEFSRGLAHLNEQWGLEVTACADRRDLSAFGIRKGRCISYPHVKRIFGADPELAALLGSGTQATVAGESAEEATPRHLVDRGQRAGCGCVVSKDIGQYNTCLHGCVYCYANASPAGAARNHARYREDAARGIFHESIVE